MKRIHFDDLQKGKYWIFILLLSLAFILVEEFPFEFEDIRVYKYIRATGFLMQTIYWAKFLWFKNSIQYNKKGATIRVNSFLGKSVRFSRVKDVHLTENNLIVTENTGKIMTFNLEGIVVSDIEKLNEILVGYMVDARG